LLENEDITSRATLTGNNSKPQLGVRARREVSQESA